MYEQLEAALHDSCWAAEGEAVVNATIGALLNDDGKLAIMPSVVDALSELDSTTVAAYAPIAWIVAEVSGRPEEALASVQK